MMSALFRAILLAGIAHVAFFMPTKDNSVLVTSSISGDTAAHSRRNLLSLDGNIIKSISGSNAETHETVVDSGPSSVVQDWSLVCKQLCGAGLGGEPCNPHCTDVHDKLPNVQQSNVDSILNPNKELICRDLCRLQLGKENCQCSNDNAEQVAIKPTTISLTERNEVCNTFCINNGATLAGCSLCKLQQLELQQTMPVAMLSAAVAVADISVDAEAAAADGGTTTPNWNELCVTLCKTGDGGSLCKCDLSPFFV